MCTKQSRDRQSLLSGLKLEKKLACILNKTCAIFLLSCHLSVATHSPHAMADDNEKPVDFASGPWHDQFLEVLDCVRGKDVRSCSCVCHEWMRWCKAWKVRTAALHLQQWLFNPLKSNEHPHVRSTGTCRQTMNATCTGTCTGSRRKCKKNQLYYVLMKREKRNKKGEVLGVCVRSPVQDHTLSRNAHGKHGRPDESSRATVRSELCVCVSVK